MVPSAALNWASVMLVRAIQQAAKNERMRSSIVGRFVVMMIGNPENNGGNYKRAKCAHDERLIA